MNNDPLAPRLLVPRVPRDLETICLKCLEKEPSRPYQTAQELADELGRFLRDEPVLARPVTRVEQAWRWCRRKPALASLGASLVFVLTLGFAGTLWQWRQALHNAQAEARQRQLADENRERADQNLYDSDMYSAQHAWDEGDLGDARSRLQAHLPRFGEKTDRRGFEWFYFWKLCEGDQRMTLTNHGEAVSCVAFSPDGKRLATGTAGDDDPVQIWDTATGKIVTTLPKQNVMSLAFSPYGRALGVGGRDRVVVWNLETGRAVFRREETHGQFRIAFSPLGTGLAIGKGASELGVHGGSTELWDYVADESKHIFPDSGGYIAFSPRGDQLATANWNGITKIWDLASRRLVRNLKTGGVIAMAFSPDGQTLATTDWTPSVQLWAVSTGQKLGSLTDNRYRVWSLAFSPNGRFLAMGSADQTVSLWEVATRRQTERLRGHGGEVTSVVFAADGQTLASGSRDQTAMLWSVHQDRAVTTVSNVISRPVFSPDGRLVAAGIGQNKVAAWDVATLQLKAVFADAYDAVGFSPDGLTLLTRGTNYSLRAFEVATQAVRNTVPGRPAEETDSWAALSPDGQILLTGLNDGTLMFSHAKSGAVIATTAHARNDHIFQIDFSPDGKLVAIANRESEVDRVPAAEIWDLATHKKVATLRGHTKTVLSVAFSPDGKTVATCGADKPIKFWDATTWKEIPPSLGHKEFVTCLAFSPNGRTLASLGSDGTMIFWNANTRHKLASLKVDHASYTFSPDGHTLAGWHSISSLLRLWRGPVPDK